MVRAPNLPHNGPLRYQEPLGAVGVHVNVPGCVEITGHPVRRHSLTSGECQIRRSRRQAARGFFPDSRLGRELGSTKLARRRFLG